MEAAMIPFSVLDLSPIPAGSTAADAFRHSRELAQHAEKLGYLRFWLAEHHNMTGIASAATSVVIGHVAAGTSTIRVGSDRNWPSMTKNSVTCDSGWPSITT